jgi:adenosylmethionine-8-amino-7-oxononanoate aminotransferase
MDAADQISDAQTTEERFLRQIFVRDQMAEWSKAPLVMSRADGVHYWDVHGKRYLDALSGIYVVSVGHNNRRVIEAIRRQLDVLAFSPPMHGTNPLAIRLANVLAQLAPGDLSAVKLQCGGSSRWRRAFCTYFLRRAIAARSARTIRAAARPAQRSSAT